MLNNMKHLVGFLILIAGLAYWVSQTNGSEVFEMQALVPEWQTDVAQMAEIDEVILVKGEDQIQLKKLNNSWVLNKGFFAAVDPLFDLMQGVKNAQIVEAKTANANNHELLELADHDLKVIFSAEGEKLQSIHFGKATAGGNLFVRREGENQTYAVNGLSPVAFNIEDWQLDTVLDIENSEIQKIILSTEPDKTVNIELSNEVGEWTLNNLPAGYQVKESAYLGQLGDSLSRFKIDGAIKESSLDYEQQFQLFYSLIDGVELRLNVIKKGAEYFITINSESYAQYDGWVMEIAEYKYNSLNRSLDDYIELIPTSEPEINGAEEKQENTTETVVE